MATYDFTNSWDLKTKDDTTYGFTQADYNNAIELAQITQATNNQGELGTLAPGGSLGMHTSIQSGLVQFGDLVDLLNYVDFDLANNSVGEWQSMIDILELVAQKLLVIWYCY